MKNLYTFIFVLFAVCGLASAQTVVFDIANNPWDLPLGSGSGATAEAGNVTQITQDNVIIDLALTGESGTPPRMWTGNQLRLFANNTLSISARANIQKVVFTFNVNNAKDAAGEAVNYLMDVAGQPITSGQEWLGSEMSANFITAHAKGNLQVSRIEVTLANSEPEYIPAGSGTLADPYNVDAVRTTDVDAGIKEYVWVKGVILGYANGAFNKDKVVAGVSGAIASNIVIIDEAHNSVVAMPELDYMAPVQLPVGDVRSALNLPDNPSNLGKTVWLFGNIEKYFGVAGVKNVTKYSFDGENIQPSEFQINYSLETHTASIQRFQLLSANTITIPSSIEKDGITYSVTTIEADAFSDCTALTSVVIPESIVQIEARAFSGCSNLSDITIPQSVEYVGDEAFYGTAWYDNQPNGVVYAGSVAYKYKGSMQPYTKIGIKTGTKSISDNAFSKCTNLVSVTFPTSLCVIGKAAFYCCSGLTALDLTDNISDIGDNAFRDCNSVQTISIGQGIKHIGSYVFMGCSAIVDVSISNLTCWCSTTLDDMFSSPLYYAHRLIINDEEITDLTIPDGIEVIGRYTFNECSNIISLSIPSSIRSINDMAFANCSALCHVYCHATEVPITSNNAFTNIYTRNATLHVPASAIQSYRENEPWSSFGSIDDNFKAGEDELQTPASKWSAKKVFCSLGETVNVQFTTNSDGAVTYSSSDESVAVVDAQGVITAVGVGKATITATTAATATYRSSTDFVNVIVSGNGKGSKKTPYTPDEIITRGAYAEKIPEVWVRGFIVGCVNGQSLKNGAVFFRNRQNAPVTRANEEVANTNLLIAVDVEETNYEKCIPVQLPSGEVRDALNMRDHSELAFAEVELYGDIDKYFGVAGLKNVTAYSIIKLDGEPTIEHTLKYIIDGVVYKEYSINVGDVINPEPDPAREGYSFSGWSWIPSRMPDEDVVITGIWSVNYYTVTYIVDGEVYKTEQVAFGSAIIPPVFPAGSTLAFKWYDLVETMPAHDITITGKSYTVGIAGIDNARTGDNHFFTIDGRRTTTPHRGVNIIRNADGTVRKVIVK